MSLSNEEKAAILGAVRALVIERHIDPRNPTRSYDNWAALVDDQSAGLTATKTDQDFELGVANLLGVLGTSHTALIAPSGQGVPTAHALHATLRRIESPRGFEWLFWDVLDEGIAARAGLKPGEVLVAVDGKPLATDKPPLWGAGKVHELTTRLFPNGTTRLVSIQAGGLPIKGQTNIQPRAISHKMLSKDVGYLRVARFPGAVGLDFVKALGQALQDLNRHGCQRLVVDLRGNVGGGLGSLRLMSLFCPDKRLVGYTLTRKRATASPDSLPSIDKVPDSKLGAVPLALRFLLLNRDRSMRLVTEGLGQQPFHSRISVLQNRFSHSAAEMVTTFAKANGLATIIGEPSAGEVLGGANFTLPSGYRLRIPIAAWFTSEGQPVEGKGVEPNERVDQIPEHLARAIDDQLEQASAHVHR